MSANYRAACIETASPVTGFGNTHSNLSFRLWSCIYHTPDLVDRVVEAAGAECLPAGDVLQHCRRDEVKFLHRVLQQPQHDVEGAGEDHHSPARRLTQHEV